ncbi:MAG: isoprenylcysteine carboxylmethyltransferase family protein [Candidatus Poribacteria bacterium]|nr:isoprenylcysteine carboxylmethyltransferase family protein [Candidatus Poribacteria bacterium]
MQRIAPFVAALVLSVLTVALVLATRRLGFESFDDFVPTAFRYVVGGALVVVFAPLLPYALMTLGFNGLTGRRDDLVTTGAFRVVRHPFYAAVCGTLFGVGWLVNETGVSLAGLVWFGVVSVQAAREERDLIARHGDAYVAYAETTPRLVPTLRRLVTRDSWRTD